MHIKMMEEMFISFVENNKPLHVEGEVYFYILGRTLKWAFDEWGGVDAHRNEFNHLTNPYLPTDVRTLSLRTLNFLKRFRQKNLTQNQKLLSVMDYLIIEENKLFTSSINHLQGEEAFYGGLFHQ